MFDRIIHAIYNGILLVALSILTVDGSKNLDKDTANILVKITVPVMALATIVFARDLINYEQEHE